MPRNGGGRSVYVPPSGVLGAGQQTQAGQAALIGGGGPFSRTVSATGSLTRRRRPKRRVKKSAATSRRRSSPARLVKGSRAAKLFMARLRRKRRK